MPSLAPPTTDPTPIFEHYRGSYGSELLTAAVAHLGVFRHLAAGPMSLAELRAAFGIEERAAVVLMVALRAMKLVAGDWPNRLELTPAAREHLVPGGAFYVGDYLGLSADAPGVLEMVRRLRTNAAAPDKTAAGADATMFTFRDGVESAMDDEAAARKLTLALAGRAKNVAPALARNLDWPAPRSCSTSAAGPASTAWPCSGRTRLRAVVWDRPAVLKVAREFAGRARVARPGRAAAGRHVRRPVPAGSDAILVSNILHDWDAPECRTLVAGWPPRCRPAAAARPRRVPERRDGRPAPIALYSAALFSVTEGGRTAGRSTGRS
jgi:hypothetical protein